MFNLSKKIKPRVVAFEGEFCLYGRKCVSLWKEMCTGLDLTTAPGAVLTLCAGRIARRYERWLARSGSAA
jgi:hypothetical protein